MPTYNLYIGANNDTGLVETDKIVEIVSANHEGFTLVHASGYWHGTPEPSVIVTIDDDENVVTATVSTLVNLLRQDAIGVQVAYPIRFVTPLG